MFIFNTKSQTRLAILPAPRGGMLVRIHAFDELDGDRVKLVAVSVNSNMAIPSIKEVIIPLSEYQENTDWQFEKLNITLH